MMMERYVPADLNAARRRMARIPAGAELIQDPISKARGFRVGNVFVLAGVPTVMQAMLDFAGKTMKAGAVMLVEVIAAGSIPGGPIRRGSPRDRRGSSACVDRLHPAFKDGRFNNQIVVRGKDDGAVAAARRAVEEMVAGLAGNAAER